jgi:error-prone DNA polymerase
VAPPQLGQDAPAAYAELQCRSHFSFLTGASDPEELVQRAQVQGYAALALTDECSLAGVVRAHVALKRLVAAWRERAPERDPELELPHLILGSQFAVHDDEAGPEAPPAFTLVALACQREGYGQLSQFITANRHLFKKPRKIKTSFGTFGLQDVAEVIIVDSEKAIKWSETLTSNTTICFKKVPTDRYVQS